MLLLCDCVGRAFTMIIPACAQHVHVWRTGTNFERGPRGRGARRASSTSCSTVGSSMVSPGAPLQHTSTMSCKAFCAGTAADCMKLAAVHRNCLVRACSTMACSTLQVHCQWANTISAQATGPQLRLHHIGQSLATANDKNAIANL